MNWRGVLFGLALGLALGAALRAGGLAAEHGTHRTSAARFGLSGHEQAAVCRSLVRAGVLVSCTYEGEK